MKINYTIDFLSIATSISLFLQIKLERNLFKTKKKPMKFFYTKQFLQRNKYISV